MTASGTVDESSNLSRATMNPSQDDVQTLSSVIVRGVRFRTRLKFSETDSRYVEISPDLGGKGSHFEVWR